MSGSLSELRGRVLWVVLGCLVVQLGVGYGYAGSALAPFLEDSFGWSRAEIASTRAAQPLLVALASPLVGFLAARFGARFVLASGTLVLGGSFMLGAGIETKAELVGVWAIQGLSVALLGDIAVGSVVTQWTRRSRSLALGIAYTGANLGGALTARTLAAVAGVSSWRVGMFVLGGAAIAILLPAALLMVRDRGLRAAEPVAAAEPDEALPLREVLATRSFWILLFVHISYWLYLLLVLESFVFMLRDSGMAMAEAAGHLANTTLMGGVAKIAFGFMALRLSARNAMLLDYGLLSMSAALLLMLDQLWAVYAFVLVFGFGYAARDIVTPLVIASCYGTRVVAQVYGVVMLTFLISPLGGIVAGLSFDLTGSYDPAIMSIGGLIVVSFFLLFWLPNDGSGRPAT